MGAVVVGVRVAGADVAKVCAVAHVCFYRQGVRRCG